MTNGTASMKAVTKPNETGLFNIILTQMKQMIQIRCKNNKKSLNVPTGSTLSEIFSLAGLKMDYGPVSCKVNNVVEGLHYRIYNNKDLE